MKEESKIKIYKTKDNNTQVEVRFEEETVWKFRTVQAQY